MRASGVQKEIQEATGVAGETGVGGGGRSQVVSSAHALYSKGERKSLKDEGWSWCRRMLKARS